MAASNHDNMNTKTATQIFVVISATILLGSVGALSSTSIANAQIVTQPNPSLGSNLANPSLGSNLATTYLTIKNAIVLTNGLHAALQTAGTIPTDGSGGAFGYGILTSQGIGAVIVSTTHKGVKDSITQRSAADPIWHNHFVKLAVGVTGLCGRNPEVVAITFQQPGRVFVAGNTAFLQGIPSSFTGTDALSGRQITLSPGHDVQNVVSFILHPIFQAGALKAVCVENITPAQHITKI
jgi:hypothetical protein